MRLFATVILATLAVSPVSGGEPEKPVTQKDVSAGDVVTTPVSDLNLKKGEIPPLLEAAILRPYSLRGLGNCRQIAVEVREFDKVLGEDLDLPQSSGQRPTPGRMAQSVVGSFIPFRGVIREVSGASSRERGLQEAIMAGVARRSFLKGAGEARGCAYPARSVTREVYDRRMAALAAETPPAKKGGQRRK